MPSWRQRLGFRKGGRGPERRFRFAVGSKRQGSGTREQGLGKRSFSVCGDGRSESFDNPEEGWSGRRGVGCRNYGGASGP